MLSCTFRIIKVNIIGLSVLKQLGITTTNKMNHGLFKDTVSRSFHLLELLEIWKAWQARGDLNKKLCLHQIVATCQMRSEELRHKLGELHGQHCLQTET